MSGSETADGSQKMIKRDGTAADSESNSHGVIQDTGNNKKLITVPVGQAVCRAKMLPRKRRKMRKRIRQMTGGTKQTINRRTKRRTNDGDRSCRWRTCDGCSGRVDHSLPRLSLHQVVLLVSRPGSCQPISGGLTSRRAASCRHRQGQYVRLQGHRHPPTFALSCIYTPTSSH